MRTIGGDSPVTVIAHSSAVHPAVAAINAANLHQCRLLLIAPSLPAPIQAQSIVQLAAIGLSQTNPQLTQEMLGAASNSRSFFDAEMQRALRFAATDSTLFSRYWCDSAAFELFQQSTAGANDGFDLDGFVTILSELASRQWTLPTPVSSCSISTVVGSKDPIIDVERTRRAMRDWADGAPFHVFDERGHWLHLEAPDRFCDVVESVVHE